MAHKFVVDTHALVWFLEGNPKISGPAQKIMEDPNNELILPMISLAESMYIVEKGRTGIANVADLLSRPGEQRKGDEKSMVAIGQSASDRYLRVIYTLDPQPNSVFVITPYEIHGKPWKAHRRRKRGKRR